MGRTMQKFLGMPTCHDLLGVVVLRFEDACNATKEGRAFHL